MYDLKGFLTDFETARLQNKEEGNIAEHSGWTVYQKTRDTPLDFVIFGRHLKDENHNIVSNSDKRGITQQELNNFKHPSSAGSADSLQGGSILSLVKEGWRVTYNDAWICGAVHGLKEFHCASDLKPSNVFDKKFGLTVTGRELVGLHLAGFVRQQTVLKDGSRYVVFRNGVTSSAANLTLASYSSAMAQLNTEAKARKFMNKKMALWN